MRESVLAADDAIEIHTFTRFLSAVGPSGERRARDVPG